MSRYFDMVDHPSHVRKLTVPQLQQLADEIRQELITVHSDTHVGEVVNRMKEHDVSQIPVVGDGNRLIGMVNEVNLLKYLLSSQGGDAANQPIGSLDLVERNVVTVAADMPLESVMGLFNTNPVAVVVDSIEGDESGRAVGILTKIDMLSFLTAQV